MLVLGSAKHSVTLSPLKSILSHVTLTLSFLFVLWVQDEEEEPEISYLVVARNVKINFIRSLVPSASAVE